MSDLTWVSFGENCLPQYLIDYAKANTVYTPFSFGRTNIDYLLYFERNGYDQLKDNDNFVHRTENFHNTSFRYEVDTGNAFAQVSRVVEFVHHDIFSNQGDREKIYRRIDRMTELKKHKLAILYYHLVDADNESYPSLEKTGNGRLPSKDHVLSGLNKIKEFYPNAKILFFYRIHSDTRSISLVSSDNNIHEFAINTPNMWNEENWDGRSDYDLLLEMLKRFNRYFFLD